MPERPMYRSHVLDHLGLGAGMCDALGLGDVIDQATHHNPARRDLTAGEAVTARGLHGLGVVNHALSRVPRCFQPTPTSRRMAPRVPPAPLPDEARGRTLATLEDDGVTARSRRMAATAATRLGLAPRCAPRDRPSVPVDGRSHSAEEPDAEGMPSTRGSSREHRPARKQGMLELRVEPQAGLPLLMPPRSGPRSDAPECGQVSKAPMAPWQTTDGLPSLVAASALSSADHRQKLAETRRQWSTRVPATLRAAPQALPQAAPQGRAPRTEGSRAPGLPSSDGGGAHRWRLVDAAPRQVQAPRTVDTPRLQQGPRAVAACQTRGRMTLAWAAAAQQALATVTHGCHATDLPEGAWRAPPRYRPRGRPRQDAQPARLVDTLTGALASSRAARPPLVDQPRGCSRATTAVDATLWPPTALCAGSPGQAEAARGGRCLTAPQWFASSRALTTPARVLALLRGLTVCVLVSAA